MKKFIIFIFIIILLILIIGIFLNNTFCFNTYHKDSFPVNPYCTKCHGRDGIVQHECKNPNGKDRYCRTCGKIVFNK